MHDVRGLVLQPQIKTSPNFQQMNKPYRISSFFINLVVKNEEGGVGGGGGLTVGLEQLFPLFYMKNENVACFPFPPHFKKATLNFFQNSRFMEIIRH